MPDAAAAVADRSEEATPESEAEAPAGDLLVEDVSIDGMCGVY
jgi:mycofactocin precursor